MLPMAQYDRYCTVLAGAQSAWGHAQLLCASIRQAARAIIDEGAPINPHRADDIT